MPKMGKYIYYKDTGNSKYKGGFFYVFRYRFIFQGRLPAFQEKFREIIPLQSLYLPDYPGPYLIFYSGLYSQHFLYQYKSTSYLLHYRKFWLFSCLHYFTGTDRPGFLHQLSISLCQAGPERKGLF